MGRASSCSGCPTCLLSVLFLTIVAARLDLPLENIKLPTGFSIKLYANDALPGVRFLCPSKAFGRLVYASVPGSDSVYAVIDNDGDGVAEAVRPVVTNLRKAQGMVWDQGSLYVIGIDTLARYDSIDAWALEGFSYSTPSKVITTSFPSYEHHGLKGLAMGADGRLFFNVGAPCNVCELEKWGNVTTGSINVINKDGTGLKTYVTGLRNAEGITFHPTRGEMWITNMGRDEIGDDRPDDTLHRVANGATFGGFPYCHNLGLGSPLQRDKRTGPAFADPDVNGNGKAYRCSSGSAAINGQRRIPIGPRKFMLAAQALGPHVAPLGLTFYTGNMFPANYSNTIFIAEHGSWNRALKIGYRMAVVTLTDDGRTVASHKVFASGWLQNEGNSALQSVWGRPVDVAQLQDGSLLLTDDQNGAIYRITYKSAV